MKKTSLFKAIALTCVLPLMVSGCDTKPPKPSAPSFDDKEPPAPKLAGAYDENGLPEPMDLSKGSAKHAIDHSIGFLGEGFDINDRIKLETLLTGYFGFNEYLAQQVGESQPLPKYYASKVRISPGSSNIIINVEDMDDASKKLFVI